MNESQLAGVTTQFSGAAALEAWHAARPRGSPRYAGFGRGLLASMVDELVLVVVRVVVVAFLPRILDNFFGERAYDASWVAFVALMGAYFASITAVDWLYFAGLESSAWQATLGKRALGIAVTDVAGRRISFGRASGRYFAHYLSLLCFGIGFLVQPFTERRQALHDVVAGTVVVRT